MSPRAFDRSRWPDVQTALAEAFMDDPLVVHFVPDGSLRRPWLLAFMRTQIRGVERCGRARLIEGSGEPSRPDGVHGAILPLPPGGHPTPLLARIHMFMGVSSCSLGSVPLGRLESGLALLRAIARDHVAGPHWYIAVLGVRPEAQGRGFGGALLGSVLEPADDRKMPCYLETAKPENLAFYQRFGFDVEKTIDIAEAPRVWTMLRPARSR